MNPLTGIYGAVTAVRNQMFDRGLLSAQRLEQPVVSVGNLSTGGAGKTPFVIALGELLLARGVRFDVLSRGYRRKTRGVLVVEPGVGEPGVVGPGTVEPDRAAADFGDEPLLIARRLGVPVIVGESRFQAGQLAEQKFHPQLHILDDGFQHRSLARDFDIVLMTAADFDDPLLPAGRLREPLSALARADAIVLPEAVPADHPALRQKPIWRSTRDLILPAAFPAAPIVFCGLARPQQFFAQVRAAGIVPAKEIVFRDHHSYSRNDIARLQATRRQFAATGFLTTEKDAVNLGSLQSGLAPLAIARLQFTLADPSAVIDAILAKTIFAGAIFSKTANPMPRS